MIAGLHVPNPEVAGNCEPTRRRCFLIRSWSVDAAPTSVVSGGAMFKPKSFGAQSSPMGNGAFLKVCINFSTDMDNRPPSYSVDVSAFAGVYPKEHLYRGKIYAAPAFCGMSYDFGSWPPSDCRVTEEISRLASGSVDMTKELSAPALWRNSITLSGMPPNLANVVLGPAQGPQIARNGSVAVDAGLVECQEGSR